MPVVFNNTQIQQIIKNLTIGDHVPHNYVPFQLQVKKAPHEYIGCGFNALESAPTQYDFDRDFQNDILRIGDQTKTEWLPRVGAVSVGPDVMASSVPNPLQATITENLFPKIDKAPIHMQMATEQMQLLQQAYNKSAYKSALYIIREVMKLLCYDVMIVRDPSSGSKQHIRNLAYNPKANNWELQTRGEITLLDLDMQQAIKTDKTSALAKNQEFNIAKIEYESCATFCPKLKSSKNPPDPTAAPQFGLSKYGAHGFLLQDMQLTDVSETPGQIGLIATFEAFVQLIPNPDKTVLKVLVEYLQPKLPGQTLSPNLASVLTGPLNLRLEILEINNETRKSATTKLIKLLLKQPITIFKHDECGKLAYPAQTTDILLLPEIIALNQGREYFTVLEPFFAPGVYAQIKFDTGFVPKYFLQTSLQKHLPNRIQPLFSTKQDFEHRYPPDLIKRFTTALGTTARQQEFSAYGLLPCGGYGVNTPGAHAYNDDDYKSFIDDLKRGNRLQGETLASLRTKRGIPASVKAVGQEENLVLKTFEVIMPQESHIDASSSSHNNALVPLNDDEEPTLVSLEPDIQTTLAQIHFEIIKRIYNQSVSNLPEYLITQTSTVLGLNWNILSFDRLRDPEMRQNATRVLKIKLPPADNAAAKGTTNICYADGKWYCQTTKSNILFRTLPTSLLEPLVHVTNICISSFTMPDLAGVDYSQDVQTIVNGLDLKKGFEVETTSIHIRLPGLSSSIPQRYLRLVYLFFQWVISQSDLDRQSLLNYLFHFLRQ